MSLQSHRFLAGLALLATTGAALAHSGATGIVKERMMAMKSVAASTKALSRLDWQNIAEARATAQREAGNIAAHAQQMVALFPAGSTQHPSEAGKLIWTEQNRFEALAVELETASQMIVQLAPAASRGGDIATPMKRLTATCKACHADFRVKR